MIHCSHTLCKTNIREKNTVGKAVNRHVHAFKVCGKLRNYMQELRIEITEGLFCFKKSRNSKLEFQT